MPTHATTILADRRRAVRLMLAWIDGDQLAIDTVVAEVLADNVGASGILFALTEFATSIGEEAAPDFTEQLRALLLLEQDDGQGGRGSE